MTASNIARITFLHPSDSKTFEAEINDETTGAQAIEGLVTEKFLEPASTGRGYALGLARTNATIPLHHSLLKAGVKDGDTVTVVLTGQAAA